MHTYLFNCYNITEVQELLMNKIFNALFRNKFILFYNETFLCTFVKIYFRRKSIGKHQYIV